jgi:hypothetical protein
MRGVPRVCFYTDSPIEGGHELDRFRRRVLGMHSADVFRERMPGVFGALLDGIAPPVPEEGNSA